jgi:plasmid maintenance system antidote protein VapI
MKDAFYERFAAALSEHEISLEDAASVMGVKIDVVRRLIDGRTKQAKLDEALRLCERYEIDPWFLAFGRSRATAPAASSEKESHSPDVRTLIGALQKQILTLTTSVLQAHPELKGQLMPPAPTARKRRNR